MKYTIYIPNQRSYIKTFALGGISIDESKKKAEVFPSFSEAHKAQRHITDEWGLSSILIPYYGTEEEIDNINL